MLNSESTHCGLNQHSSILSNLQFCEILSAVVKPYKHGAFYRVRVASTWTPAAYVFHGELASADIIFNARSLGIRKLMLQFYSNSIGEARRHAGARPELRTPHAPTPQR
jgi:hypothetical protein